MAYEFFDDGNAEVPGGLAGPVERVIVVGAGIAGLTVANALTHRNVECVVVEARDRIGGRLHTVDVGATPVDLGGSWIHTPIGNPLSALAERLGVSRRAGSPMAELAGYDCGEARRLSREEVQTSLDLAYRDFPEALDRLRVELGADASVSEAIDAFVAGAGLAPGPKRRARQGLRAIIEAEAADLSERQSLRWMWTELEYEGDYLGDLPSGGYRSVVEAMAGGVDIRLGAEVEEVIISSNGVRVRTADGGVEDGSHVVVTVPLGVLKRGAPQFSPPLPADRIEAIDRLGFGRFEKIVLTFEQPFWRAAGVPHLIVFPRDPAESTVWMIGQDAFGAGPTMVCLVFHSDTGHVLDETPDQAAEWVLGMLAEATGGACPAPTAIAVSSWGNDPYSGGAYTHIQPGADPSDADLLGQPIGGRLLFAGEHTQSARVAYADGALSSGVREAKRLLNQPDVLLGRISAPMAEPADA